MNYKFNEDKILEELKSYVDLTYGQHYAAEKFQTLEVIEAAGNKPMLVNDCNTNMVVVGFCYGNMIKYLQRLGNKKGWNRDDLLKVMHYGILLLHFSRNLESDYSTKE